MYCWGMRCFRRAYELWAVRPRWADGTRHGAARGLGRAIALALAEAGADVALGLRDASRDDGLAGEIRALGRRALPVQMDVANLDEVEAAVAHTVEGSGRSTCS